MATGGGVIKEPPTDNVLDGILDCVDIELKDVIDSDEAMLSINYALVDNTLIPIETAEINVDENGGDLPSTSSNRQGIFEDDTPTKSSTFKRNTTKSTAFGKVRQRGSAIDMELEARISRIKKLVQQDEEMHMLRMEKERELYAMRLEIEKTKLEAEKLVLEDNKKKFK